MDITGGLSIGRTFLTQLDDLVATNWQYLRCNDIYKLYFEFSNDLKNFRGNANGFTGLSEYLIFRFLYHQLGGSFRKESWMTSGVSQFVGKDCRIGQNVPLYLGDEKRRCVPDIVLYQEDSLIAAIQIKVYLTTGRKEVDKEMETFKELRKTNPEGFRAMLLIYDHSPSDRGLVRQELCRQKNTNDWFDFLVLRGNDESLAIKLNTSLQLGRLQPQPPKDI